MVDFKKHFDKIYVINLDKRVDRFETFQKEMEKYSIHGVERFPAINGKLIEYNGSLLFGEIGVLMSHFEIIKKAKEEDLNNVLILEDDVFFTDEILKLDDYISNVPKDWDFIYFGGNHVYGQPPIKINEKVLKLNFTVALQCVAINKQMFDVILAILPKMAKQVDGYYANLHNVFNAYGFTPNMAKQMVGFSDIQNRNVDYSNFFKD